MEYKSYVLLLLYISANLVAILFALTCGKTKLFTRWVTSITETSDMKEFQEVEHPICVTRATPRFLSFYDYVFITCYAFQYDTVNVIQSHIHNGIRYVLRERLVSAVVQIENFLKDNARGYNKLLNTV